MLSTIRYLLFPVLNLSGAVFIAFAFIMLIPWGTSMVLNDGVASGFEIGSAVSLFTGVLCLLITHRYKRELIPRDGFLLATLIWVIIPIFASIPLYLGIPGISFTHAFFEAMSGTTTTCATVLSNLDSLPASINLWRCLLSWLGGMGILVLAVAILPLLGVGGAQVFKAEASGPMKESKLTPRIADTAKGLWWIYVGLTIACIVSYDLAGMSLFDAILHTFTTVSLGGFSSHDASFGYWNSPTIELVSMSFMVLCGISFTLHFLAWKRRSLLPYFKSPEALGWLLTVCGTIGFVTALLYFDGRYENLATALRYASFNVISVISTTGYANADYYLWPVAAPILMMTCSCFASCGGSTGGGVKMMRAIILVKQTLRELTLTLHPKAVLPLEVGHHAIANSIVFSVLAYMLLWAAVTIVSSVAMMTTGLDPISAVSAVVACITNTGPGLAQVGPSSTFAVLSDAQLWLCSFCMLVGRLELMTVFVLFTRAFWHT